MINLYGLLIFIINNAFGSYSSGVRRISFFLILNVLSILILVSISHQAKSLALTAFTYLIVFDLFRLLSSILNIWIKFNISSNAFPYGVKRAEVLAVFASTILSMLGSFFITKECVESLFEEKEIHTSRYLPTVLLSFLIHMTLNSCVKNESFEYVIKASSSNWIQDHISDLCETICQLFPGLNKILLPRINPFSLLGFFNLVTLVITYLLLQMDYNYLTDTFAAMFLSFLSFMTMLPLTLYTANILLQTTPAHMISQLDKCLREASTLDGVLEFRNEHFWTLSFGTIVGSLHVRVRRDADEQLVLAHVSQKLTGLVQILTIHIFKDDWMRRSTHQLIYSGTNQITSQMPQAQFSNPLLVRKNNPLNSIVDNEYVIINP